MSTRPPGIEHYTFNSSTEKRFQQVVSPIEEFLHQKTSSGIFPRGLLCPKLPLAVRNKLLEPFVRFYSLPYLFDIK